jgi:hypothetical protein
MDDSAFYCFFAKKLFCCCGVSFLYPVLGLVPEAFLANFLRSRVFSRRTPLRLKCFAEAGRCSDYIVLHSARERARKNDCAFAKGHRWHTLPVHIVVYHIYIYIC